MANMYRQCVCAIAAMIVSIPAFALPAHADPGVDGQFTVSGVGTNNQIAAGPDGNVWVTLDAINDVARISPEGTVTEYNPVNVSTPVGVTAGPDANIWAA